MHKQQCSKPILMSHRARSRRPTLGAQLLLKESDFERFQRSEERHLHRRIEYRPDMAQVSPLVDRRGNGSRLDHYLSEIVLSARADIGFWFRQSLCKNVFWPLNLPKSCHPIGKSRASLGEKMQLGLLLRSIARRWRVKEFQLG
jgi:hypothetical protein